MADNVTFQALFREAGRAIIAAKRTLFIVWLVDFGFYSAADHLLPGDALGFAYGALGLASLYLQLLVTAVVLSKLEPGRYPFDPRRPTRGRFPSAFAQSLLYIVSVALGLVLLIVPGLILVVRWSVALPALLADDLSVTASLRRSWQLTGEHLKVASIAATVWITLLAVAVALSVILYPAYGPPTIASTFVVNIIFASSQLVAWVLAAVLYGLLRRDAPAVGSGDHLSTAVA